MCIAGNAYLFKLYSMVFKEIFQINDKMDFKYMYIGTNLEMQKTWVTY